MTTPTTPKRDLIGNIYDSIMVQLFSYSYIWLLFKKIFKNFEKILKSLRTFCFYFTIQQELFVIIAMGLNSIFDIEVLFQNLALL